MIHVSGFLKLLHTGGEGSSTAVNHAYGTVSSDNVNDYQVIGLVAECHLIESPVIMELSVQHSTFTSTISLDLKFNSVDTRYALYRICICRQIYKVFTLTWGLIIWCPDYQGVLILLVSLYDKEPLCTNTIKSK